MDDKALLCLSLD